MKIVAVNGCHICGRTLEPKDERFYFKDGTTGMWHRSCWSCINDELVGGAGAGHIQSPRRDDGAWEGLAERYGAARSTAERSEP